MWWEIPYKFVFLVMLFVLLVSRILVCVPGCSKAEGDEETNLPLI